jgi:ABC-type uncharacterized transport system involved in gliding motility auxiliary subunit
MNRTLRQIAGVVFVLVITFSLISICQKLGKGIKADITQQKLYTLSDGTKAIIGKLNQPIKMKLYYAKTAAMQAPDNIKYFDNYYEFVKSLLEEYVAQSKGMVQLEVIDPRPYSDDEVDASRYGIKRFPITQEEGFFFGLVAQTQFGVEKTIPFFSPDRQNFIEYDISSLIDTAITRQKKRIGVLSALELVGDDLSPYMARMMQMQGQQPKKPWVFVQQLKEQYEVISVPMDTDKIEGVDVLLVVHPKDFSEKTLFAIDQFVVRGGRAIVCVDPYCISDLPKQPMQMQREHNPNSEMNKLLVNWGLEMPKDTFAGDRTLSAEAVLREGQRPTKIIGFLDFTPECFNRQTVITSQLNQVRFLFSGILREMVIDQNEAKIRNIQRTPLVYTTARGNKWTVENQFELMTPNPEELWKKFAEGTEPVKTAYLVTGRFKSAFPQGIDIDVPVKPDPNDPNAPKTVKKHIDALPEAKDNCAVIVFADVDFICDQLAYRSTFFGTMTVGDNSALMTNAIDDLGGSSELISIRSRGNFKRPFKVVDEIEAQADAQTAEKEAKINAEIAGFENELQTILSSAKQGEDEVIGNEILQKKQEVELKILEAKKQLQEIKKTRLQRKEALGNSLRNFNMLTAPAVSLVVAIILGIYRSVRRRKYISHASDA